MTGQKTARMQDLSGLPDPDGRVVQLLDVWKDARKGALVPNKRDLDPISIPRLLPMVWLYRFDTKVGDFVCRLAGEEINKAWGYGIAGRTAEHILGKADHGTITAVWRSILDTPLIHYGKGERMQQNQLFMAERLVLPLVSDRSSDGRPDYLMGLSLYTMSDLYQSAPQVLLENAYHVHCADIS